MTEDARLRDRLIGGLENWLQHLQTLRDLMKAERSALAAGDIPAIESSNARKQAVLDALGQELDSTLTVVAQLGEAASMDGLDALLTRESPADVRMQALRQRLSEALLESAEQNQINGFLAYTGQREATALLGLMIGEPAGDDTAVTYGREGKRASAPARGGAARKA